MKGEEELPTITLLTQLYSLPERPWMEWKHGKPITDRGLSNLLRGFKIRSGQFRYNEKKVRGYREKDFLDAWERYLSGTDGTDLKNKGLLNNLSGTKSKSVPQKKTIASIKIRVCRLYRLEPPYLGEIGIIELARTYFFWCFSIHSCASF
jgi:hypothetical protein